jgi:hypothetical protein
MNDIILNHQEFMLFNDDDQFGFFYDDDGYPAKDASEKFNDNVAELFKKYQYISVDAQDNIYGVINGKKELMFKDVFEAYEIANEVKTG